MHLCSPARSLQHAPAKAGSALRLRRPVRMRPQPERRAWSREKSRMTSLDSRAVRVGVPRETAAGERRVALVPESVPKLTQQGLEVAVERGAGHEASFPEEAYGEAGAELVDSAFEADVVAKVAPPSADEVAALRDGAVLVGF